MEPGAGSGQLTLLALPPICISIGAYTWSRSITARDPSCWNSLDPHPFNTGQDCKHDAVERLPVAGHVVGLGKRRPLSASRQGPIRSLTLFASEVK